MKDADDWYARFHDRMAVLLDPSRYDEWLDPSHDGDRLSLLARSAYHQDGALEYFPISTLVNNPGYDSPDCLQPMTEGELASLTRREKESRAQIDLF